MQAYPGLDIRPTVFAVVKDWAGEGGRLKAAFACVLLVAVLWRTPLGPLCARLLPGPVRRALVRIADAGLVVSAGGTYLVPHYRILPKLVDLLVAYAMGRRYVLFTQSLGPFSGWQGAVVSRASCCAARD